ncbi:MAG: helix-turn-helix domain-containing protein [Clostridiales bacterium]|nr:helix-turn-helix domain-containing protein [Clostridiales bacterium]
MTQAELARKLEVTRSSVNAWEMGISMPSIAKLVELACLFHVSTDYLLGLEQENRINMQDFSEQEQSILCVLAEYFQSVHEKEEKTN